MQRNFVSRRLLFRAPGARGVGFHGNTPIGIGWDVGVTTGVNLAGWNNSPEDPQYRTALDLEDNDVAPLQATHQELQWLANAQHLSQYVSLSYTGVPGLLAGAAIFTGKAAIPKVPAGLPDERVTLWETHLRWTAPRCGLLRGLCAWPNFENGDVQFLDNTGVANPLPASFLGYYLQGAYTLWQQGSYRFGPFIRWEHYDMGASYEGIPPGFTTVPTGLAADGKPWPQPRDRVWTAGGAFS